MVSHMKTTIDIADSLLEAAKVRAAQEGSTLKQVVEHALRAHLEVGRASRKKFKLRSKPFKGNGLQSGIAEGRWDDIRSLIYPV